MTVLFDTSDGDLARAIEASSPGSGEAFETELYRRFAPRVRLYGLRHLRDEDAAGDLVQQVLLLTIEKVRAGQVRDVDQLASFILGTSRMMARDVKRREWRRERLRQTFLHANVAADPDPHDVVDRDQLEQCLARLAVRERSVILLTFYAEKTGPEVGEELQLGPGHVRVIRHRAIERLRQCIASAEGVA